MKRRFFGYIRVSTVKQGEHGSSLVEQRSAIEAYALRHDLTIVAWFEEMETAAKQGRREFTRLLNELKRGKADGLIVHKIDRSARNLRDWAELGDLIDRGIDVRFVSDNFDLLSRGGRLSADIQAVVAADYIRNLREEVKKGMYGRLKQGLYPWAAPIGYLDTGRAKPKIIDPIKGPYVRALFARYGSNTIGLEELRHEFAGLGLRTRHGTPLALRTVSNILNNPFYAGVMRVTSTGETFPGVHEPLIPGHLFERVQDIITGRTVPKAKKHRFLLRQMIRCGLCGHRTLTGEHQKSFTYYRCHGRDCRGVSWRADELEAAILAKLDRVRLSDGDVREVGDVIRGLVRAQKDDQERTAESLALQSDQVESRLVRLTDLLIDGSIDTPEHNRRREQLLLDRQGIAERRERARVVPLLEDLFSEFERAIMAHFQYELLLDDEKRELIDIVCSNVSVYGKKLEIALRSPFREVAEALGSSGCEDHRHDLRTRRIAEVLKQVAEQQWPTVRAERPRSPHVPRDSGGRPSQHGFV